jgi:tetratricopeptide (TPR) repeat protein
MAGLLAASPARPQSPALPESSAAPSSPKPDARKARKAFARGLRAEQAQDWPAAFEAYVEAARNAPGDTESLLRREAARFQMVREHTDRAEREALAGRMDQARDALRAALQLDPSYSVARERLAQFEHPWAPPQEQEPPSLASPAQVQTQPGTRNFDYRGDVRGAYLEVARQFGLIVMFDNELPARVVRFRVAGADFDTAMNVLGQQTATFWRAVDPHTFFVAADTPQKRRDYAPVVVRTMVLPASATPDKMTETLRLVREIAGATHTQLDTRTHTLTLRDSPATVALAAALIRELEQAPAEILLEIEILEVSRDAARRLGITPPSTGRLITISPTDAQALQQAQTLASLIAIAQRVFGASVPPVIAIGGGRTIFLANLPGAAADFSETLNLVRSGRRVLLRAEDGQPATFFMGDRFPVALALLGASLVSPQQIAANQIAFPRSDFATGNGPAAVAAGDFRGTGRVDLAIANRDSGTVSILLSNGDGTFQHQTTFVVGTQPSSIAIGDFNGDQKLDLAVTNEADATVSILLGNGDGTFQPQKTFATGGGPQSVITGDFDRDGKIDLAVANSTDSTISILLSNGDGTFQAHMDSPTGTKPVAAVAADFNADGKLDLVVANQDSNNISILLGNGDGTFQTHKDSGTGLAPSAVAVADLNRDSKLDLAVANQGSNTVSILLGNGDGTFGSKTDFQTGTSPVGVAVADFNGDNRLDVAVANQGSNTVTLLIGNGDGSFGARLELAVGTGPSAIVTLDLNNDGRPDLAVTDRGASIVSTILNPAASVASTTIPQIAYPGAEYEDLGLKVRATPRVHADSEVTLHLEFEIRSLSGVTINGIPVISNRTVDQIVRVRENETTLLSGIVQPEETRTITGLPGFARTAGHLAGRRDTERRDTMLLILVTPRQLRLAPRTDRSIYAGRGSGTPGAERPAVQQ